MKWRCFSNIMPDLFKWNKERPYIKQCLCICPFFLPGKELLKYFYALSAINLFFFSISFCWHYLSFALFVSFFFCIWMLYCLCPLYIYITCTRFDHFLLICLKFRCHLIRNFPNWIVFVVRFVCWFPFFKTQCLR